MMKCLFVAALLLGMCIPAYAQLYAYKGNMPMAKAMLDMMEVLGYIKRVPDNCGAYRGGLSAFPLSTLWGGMNPMGMWGMPQSFSGLSGMPGASNMMSLPGTMGAMMLPGMTGATMLPGAMNALTLPGSQAMNMLSVPGAMQGMTPALPRTQPFAAPQPTPPVVVKLYTGDHESAATTPLPEFPPGQTASMATLDTSGGFAPDDSGGGHFPVPGMDPGGARIKPSPGQQVGDSTEIPAVLAGLWTGVNEDILTVVGNRFVWTDKQGQTVTGTIAVQGDVVYTTIPSTGTVMAYRYTLENGQFTAVSQAGHRYVFNRASR